MPTFLFIGFPSFRMGRRFLQLMPAALLSMGLRENGAHLLPCGQRCNCNGPHYHTSAHPAPLNYTAYVN